MSVKDLRNKFTGKVSAGMNGMKATVDNNFAQIMRIILYVGAGLVVLIVITALMIGKGCSRPDSTFSTPVRPASDPREEDFQMLMRDELVLPVNHTFEVSDDYIDFMTLKEYTEREKKSPRLKLSSSNGILRIRNLLISCLTFSFIMHNLHN